MKTYKLAEAEKLLEETEQSLNNTMQWVRQKRKRDEDLSILSHNIFLINLHNELQEIKDKIHEYLEEE